MIPHLSRSIPLGSIRSLGRRRFRRAPRRRLLYWPTNAATPTSFLDRGHWRERVGGFRRGAQPNRRIPPQIAFQVVDEFFAQVMDYARQLKSQSEIHHVAQHSATLRFAIDEFVQAARGCCDDCQELTVEVIRGESTKFEFDLPRVGPFADLRARLDRDDVKTRARVEEAADLWLADLARADDEALLT